MDNYNYNQTSRNDGFLDYMAAKEAVKLYGPKNYSELGEQMTRKEFIESVFGNIKRAEFSYQCLENLTLSGLNLNGLNFSNSTLDGSNLTGCNLTKTDFNHANLRKVNLTGTILINSNFTCADLSDSNLDTVTNGIRGLNYHSRYMGTNFTGATLDRFYSVEGQFAYANFSKATIKNSYFDRCNFEFAVFDGINISTSTINGIKIENINGHQIEKVNQLKTAIKRQIS